jgi:hypothetical protein
MIPLLAGTAVLSVAVWTSRWYLDDVSEFADAAGAWAWFALAWGVWPALAGVFLYRSVTVTYRLTDRALLADFGPLSRPVPAVRLGAVTAVVTGGGWVARWLGVGWVEVRTADRAVRLTGVLHPAPFAERVRSAAAAERHAG